MLRHVQLTRSAALALVAGAGLLLFGLSFVDAWVVHERELRGEGYRHVVTWVSAWRGTGMPVLTVAAALALVTAAGAVMLLLRPGLQAWPLAGAAAIVLGVVLSVAWPVEQDAHASSVDLSPGPLVVVGALLAGGMLAAALAVARPSRAQVGAIAGIAMVAVAIAAAGRWAALQVGEGTGRHWQDGSYTRTATDGEPTETLTIRDGTFTIGDRWSGTWEWSGWTVVLDDDPACPDSRGTYHAHGVDEQNLRFVKVVDTCADGARAADLETGTWERDPG